MTTRPTDTVFKAPQIIDRAEDLNLDLRVLYETVIDLASQGLITANCINMAAGILLNDLGLPNYFFENITKESLKGLLASITSSISFKDGRAVLVGRVAHIDFDLAQGNNVQRVRIATRETRDTMEKVIESLISGHRREYYFGRENQYYTYIIRPETVKDYTRNEFRESRFLFNLAGDYSATPEPTRRRYEKFLKDAKITVTPFVEVFNLPATGETRFMFNSDFASPQIPILRQLFKDHGLTLMRAYWEPYWDGTEVPSSICSLYIRGEISRTQEEKIIGDIRAFLAFAINPVTELYVQGKLSFKEMLFAGNAVDFTRMFIFSDDEDFTDRQIMDRLADPTYEEAFAQRIHRANRSTFDARAIQSAAMDHPDLLKQLYTIFEQRFATGRTAGRPSDPEQEMETFARMLNAKFMDGHPDRQIFLFMARLVTSTLKTNFYAPDKRAFAFRLDPGVLDPLVFHRPVFGIFFVNGHYGCGTHMRADNISRGGLRLMSAAGTGHDSLLDNAVLLNYTTGPRAQHLKHKDICEGGAAGLIIPHAIYGDYGKEAFNDVTEGIMDLLPGQTLIADHYGRPEILFFGPDQGTADFMDDLARRAGERGLPLWHTLTTGGTKSISQATCGFLDNGKMFDLVPGEEGTWNLWINGTQQGAAQDMDGVKKKIGGKIRTCGMGATGIMAAFRTLIAHFNAREEQINLMAVGGPDGLLSADLLLCYQGDIPLAMDRTALIFDPRGLDKNELHRLAFKGLATGGAMAREFSIEKLSPRGFKIPAGEKNLALPDGRLVEDGSLFIRHFLFDPANRDCIKEARIRGCIPMDGFSDTVSQKNATAFLANFQELEFIVEGTNQFFNDPARQTIAKTTQIKQIKDSTANKGQVFSSAVGEVLPGLLFTGNDETAKGDNIRWALIREVVKRIDTHVSAETAMLAKRHDIDPSTPLFTLCDTAGDDILALRDLIGNSLNPILRQKTLVWKIMEAYIPRVLIKALGKKRITTLLNAEQMQEYRDAIITNTLASLAFYRFGLEWEAFMARARSDLSSAVESLFEAPDSGR